MKVIDSYTGQEVVPGVPVPAPGMGTSKRWELLRVDDKFFSADAIMHTSWSGVQRVPLVVRFMHPQYRFQRVGFIPS